MEIGINEDEFYEEIEDFEPQESEIENQEPEHITVPNPIEEEFEEQVQEEQVKEDDFITTLLKSKGIEDPTKIKFEDENGEISEFNWNELSNEEKLNILESSNSDPDTDLDDSEARLINAIRESGLTPAEYIAHVQRTTLDNYIKNMQEPSYQIDQYSDDELFVFDLISRMGDITDEEAQEALERAKSNETLFNKQVAAIRREYKALEDENIKQAQYEQEEQAKERYHQFADQIVNYIDNFNEFSGYDLNLTDEDRDDLYDFITGQDGAGNNYFAKALSDPKILVQTAWFALNGKQMIDDITSYFQNEIKQVRKDSYQKGLEDAKKGVSNQVVYTNKGKKSPIYDDLDNF